MILEINCPKSSGRYGRIEHIVSFSTQSSFALPDFLDYPGTEFLVVAAAEDVSEELGIALQPEQETESQRLDRSAHPVKPLFQGHWQ